MIDGKLLVSRELLDEVQVRLFEAEFEFSESQDSARRAAIEIRALLAQPTDGALTNEGAEPVALTAVAILRDDGDGGLEPDWLLEGGTAELCDGMLLLVADNAPDLCEEDGSAELYRFAPTSTESRN